MTLVRGLTSIDIAEEFGLIRYRGERSVTIAGLVLLALVPLAAAAALGSNITWLATALLSASFIGLPALAFLDAQRAGARARADRPPDETPDLVPDRPATRALPGATGTEAGSVHTALAVRAPTVYRGAATVAKELIEAPISAAQCLCYRLDIRVGEDGDLVARYTSDSEFAITCADGTQVLITGLIELTAPRYGAIVPTDRASFTLSGNDLLPLYFTRGGFACEIALTVGTEIEIQGDLSDELRPPPLGGSYRQSGAIQVVHGRAGRPVFVHLL